MKKTLQPHLLKRVPPACKGERTMRWRGRPPIGGQGSDRVSHRCSAPYTLLPLRGISPQGETRRMERKNRESYISCTIPQFPPFGGKRNESITGMRIMPYDTDSQSRNVLASPLGEEGHEVAKGWTVVILIMILDVDVTAERRHYNTHRPLKGKRLTTFCASLRSGGRRLAVRTAMEHYIGALPRTPFCHYVAFPLKGKREGWRGKTESHIFHVPFRSFPLWW